MKRTILALVAAIALFCGILPPRADADYQLLTVSGNPLTSATAPYLVLSGLSGQGAGSVTISGTFGGTYAVEGIYPGSNTWTPALTVVSPDGTVSATSITAAGSYAFNTANMSAIRVDATAGSGSPIVTISAGGGVNRILGAGVNGGKTNVVGSSPITVTNSGNTATVGCTNCVQSVTGSGNVASTGGTTPVLSLTGVVPFANGGLGSTAATPGYCMTALFGGPETISTELCSVWQVANITIPAVGSTVTLASSENKVFQVKAFTPLFASDGVYAIQGYAQTSVNNSNTVTMVVTNILSGTVGNAMSPVYVTLSNRGGTTNVTAGSGISVATPSPGSYTVSLTAPVSVANGGRGSTTATAGQCDSATSASVFATTNCAQWSVNSFVAPAVGSTVTVTANDGKLFTLNKYSPLFISDGTTAIQGYVNASVSNSASVVLYETNVDQGLAGNTLAANSLLSISGLGSSGIAGVTAGSNIAVTATNPAKPTVAVTNAPGFTGPVSAGGQITTTVSTTVADASTAAFRANIPANQTALGVYNTGGSNYPQAIQIANTFAAFHDTYIGTDSTETIQGKTATCFVEGNFFISGPTLTPDFGSDCNGNAMVRLTMFAGNFTDAALTSGKCLQATTAGQIANSPGGSCPTVYENGTLLGGSTTQEGTVSFASIANATCTTAAVTFSPAFSTAPIVMTNMQAFTNTAAFQWLAASSVTTTGFTLNYCNSQGATQTITAAWKATGF